MIPHWFAFPGFRPPPERAKMSIAAFAHVALRALVRHEPRRYEFVEYGSLGPAPKVLSMDFALHADLDEAMIDADAAMAVFSDTLRAGKLTRIAALPIARGVSCHVVTDHGAGLSLRVTEHTDDAWTVEVLGAP